LLDYAVRTCNAPFKLPREIGDEGTVALLAKMLKMKEGHVDWTEIQRYRLNKWAWRIIWLPNLKVWYANSIEELKK